MKNPIKSLIRFIVKEHVDQTAKKKEETDKRNAFVSDTGELSDSYLFDFKKGYNQNSFVLFTSNIVASNIVEGDVRTLDEDDSVPKKIKIKPVDVLKELEKIPTPFSLNNLEDKISVLRDKEKLIKQVYTKREVRALIERLENRKKYMVNRSFYDQFQNTTDEAIERLLEKYVLVMEPSDLFIPELPDEAIKVMKEYTANVTDISGKEPVFYVIGEVQDFKEKYKKRDPILLVQSPFGFYYQILGAWDKEMLLLSEL